VSESNCGKGPEGTHDVSTYSHSFLSFLRAKYSVCLNPVACSRNEENVDRIRIANWVNWSITGHNCNWL
jgi:hypothetical protein